MMVKLNTSNQNEQAETKKDTKLIKRPGLNCENSLIARKLREEQERNRNSLSPKGGRNYDTTTNDSEPTKQDKHEHILRHTPSLVF